MAIWLRQERLDLELIRSLCDDARGEAIALLVAKKPEWSDLLAELME